MSQRRVLLRAEKPKAAISASVRSRGVIGLQIAVQIADAAAFRDLPYLTVGRDRAGHTAPCRVRSAWRVRIRPESDSNGSGTAYLLALDGATGDELWHTVVGALRLDCRDCH